MENKYQKNFEKNGYILISDKEVNLNIKKLTKQIILSLKRINKDFNSSNEDTDLIKFISEVTKNEVKNSVSGKIYEFLPALTEVYQFSVNKNLLAFLKKISIKLPTLGTVPMIRIDRPKNNFYSTPWHQDYWFSFSSLDSIVIWIPLGEISKNHGYLKIFPNSHKLGLIPFKFNENSNEPLTIKNKVDESKAIEVQMNFGDILIFKQSLLHKSGTNVSNEPRVSMQLRYNKMDNKKNLFSTFKAVHTPFVTEKQKKLI